jgi:hypothetical protein
MAVIRAQIACHTSPTLARDDVLMTPHFDFGLPIAAYQDFAEDLAMAIQAWQGASSAARKWTVKLYDTAGAPPHYPLGQHSTPTGAITEATMPRELALCLSFYSEHNRPRHRGRIYVCPGLLFATGVGGVRPNDPTIAKIMELGVLLKDAGGPDVDWCVWSRRDSQARPVTDYWVDDEWDIQRRRGQKPTKRSVAVTSEA